MCNLIVELHPERVDAKALAACWRKVALSSKTLAMLFAKDSTLGAEATGSAVLAWHAKHIAPLQQASGRPLSPAVALAASIKGRLIALSPAERHQIAAGLVRDVLREKPPTKGIGATLRRRHNQQKHRKGGVSNPAI